MTCPLVFNWAEGGRTPPLGLDRIAELGFRLVLFPIGTLLAATAGVRALLDALRRDGTPTAALPGLPTFGEFTDLVGLPEITELEERWAERLTRRVSPSERAAGRARGRCRPGRR